MADALLLGFFYEISTISKRGISRPHGLLFLCGSRPECNCALGRGCSTLVVRQGITCNKGDFEGRKKSSKNSKHECGRAAKPRRDAMFTSLVLDLGSIFRAKDPKQHSYPI